MRDLLTYAGVALILVLSAALAAPFLLDLDAFRPRIAEGLSLATGANVRLDGPIIVRFLPTPRFQAENLNVTGDIGHLHADEALFTLHLPGLLQGRLQFSQAELDGADIEIDAAKPLRPKLETALQFDSLTMERAHLAVVLDGKTALDVAGLELSAQIASFEGPISARGAFDLSGRKIAFSLATDVLKSGVLPAKAKFTLPDAAAVDLEGRIALGRTPVFEGDAKAEGHSEAGPWTADGAVVLGFGDYWVRRFSARLGDGRLADKVSGDGRFEGGRIVVAAEAATLAAPWAEHL